MPLLEVYHSDCVGGKVLPRLLLGKIQKNYFVKSLYEKLKRNRIKKEFVDKIINQNGWLY